MCVCARDCGCHLLGLLSWQAARQRRTAIRCRLAAFSAQLISVIYYQWQYIAKYIYQQLELDSQRPFLYASARWDLGHAVTLTFDLLTPKIEAFDLLPKRINAESLVKLSSFQDIALTRPKSAFCSMLDPNVTLNFDLLIPKLEAFILAPTCAEAESLVKIHQILLKIRC